MNVPGWVLRVAVGAVAVAVAAVLAGSGVTWSALGLYLGLAGVAAAIPASAAASLLVAYPAVAVVLVGDEPSWPSVLALVPLLHLLHVLCAYSAILPVRSRLHLEALEAPAKRFAWVQLSVFALAGLVVLSPGGRTDAAVEVVGLVAAVGLVVGAVLLVRRQG